MNRLIELLSSVRPVSEQLNSHLRKVMKPKQVPRNTIIQVPGQHISFMYFIEVGLLKGYRIEDGKEVCNWFQNEGNVIMSPYSWYERISTTEFIVAIEDSVIWYLSHEELDEIYEMFPEFNFTGRVLTELYYLLVWKWLDLVRSKKAAARYAYFLENFGDWVKRVPSKDIASFLGLSESHLSYSKKKPR